MQHTNTKISYTSIIPSISAHVTHRAHFTLSSSSSFPTSRLYFYNFPNFFSVHFEYLSHCSNCIHSRLHQIFSINKLSSLDKSRGYFAHLIVLAQFTNLSKSSYSSLTFFNMVFQMLRCISIKGCVRTGR